MSQTINLNLELPGDWERFKMPLALQRRLQELLDRQDRDGSLSARERKEAQALVDLSEMFTLMKLRATGNARAAAR